MRCSLVFIVVHLLYFSACFASPPKSKEDFLVAVRAAYEAKDVKRIDELTWEKGISESDREVMDQWIQRSLKNGTGVESISFEPLAGHKPQTVLFGKRMESTFPPVGTVKMVLKPKPPSIAASTSVQYAVIDGSYYLVTTKTKDIGWKGPPDRSFAVIVEGRGQDKVKFHVKYNASGVNLESDDIHGLACQYIDEAKVTSADDDVDVTLRIFDGMKPVYESELRGKGQIAYENGNQSEH